MFYSLIIHTDVWCARDTCYKKEGSKKSDQEEKKQRKNLIYNANETHQFQTCANINFSACAVTFTLLLRFTLKCPLTLFQIYPNDPSLPGERYGETRSWELF